jgi:photosystem II stability/assembly factor-like uncharacterized protein
MMPNGVLYGLDVQTGKVDRSASFSYTAMGLIAVGGNSILATGFRPYVGNTFLVSDDFGRTWKELPLTRFIMFGGAKDRQTLYAAMPDGSTWGTKYQVQSSRDGGTNWTFLGTPPEGRVIRMVVDKSDGSLLMFYRDGPPARSRDEGKTWSREE